MSSNMERQIAPGQAAGNTNHFGHVNCLIKGKEIIRYPIPYISNAECRPER